MKKNTQKALAFMAFTLFLSGCANSVPSSENTSSIRNNNAQVTTKNQDPCTIIPSETIREIMNEEYTSEKLSGSVPSCIFKAKAKPSRSLTAILKFEDSTQIAKAGYESSKEFQLQNLDLSLFKTIEISGYGDAAFGWYSKAITQVIAYKNTKYLVTSGTGFETAEKSLEKAKNLMKEYLNRI